MEYGIGHLSVIPIRSEAKDTSEIVSQLLFGESFQIVKSDKQWVKIICDLDSYEGWIDEKQFVYLDKIDRDRILAGEYAVTYDLVQPVSRAEKYVPVLMGSTLPFFDGMNLKLGRLKYVYNGQAVEHSNMEVSPERLIKTAKKYLHAPYLWGGRSPFGIDCSGFTQVCFKMLGIQLSRDARQQIEHGSLINLIDESRSGDLAFFENKAGKIHHVGIILSKTDEDGVVLKDREIIHAAGRVRIDRIDHFGIFNEEEKKYTHTLRMIKRLL